QHGFARRGPGAAQPGVPRRGHRVLLLLRQRVQRGVPEARGSGRGRQPGQVQRGDRLADRLRRVARREVAMARPVNPHAMAPSRPGRTRTAPPQAPSGWYAQPRMLKYLLFDATGIVYLLVGFVALRVVWALGTGPERWQELQRQLANPLYVAF